MNVTQPWRVLILGGGYAGIMCANRLAGTMREQVTITLVNPVPQFVERIRLHEVAAGTGTGSATRHGIRDLLHPSVRLLLASATKIRAGERQVDGCEPDGRTWTETYDDLVYAVGSGAAFDRVPGAAEHAHTISTIDGARRLRQALDALPGGATMLVVGGGTTAIELVTELSATRPGLRPVVATSSRLAPTLSAKGRARVLRARAMRDVEIMEHTPVAAVTPTGVTTESGQAVAADCVVWAASFAVPGLARDSGLEVDRAGRLVVGADLRAPRHPHILGAGDGCLVTGAAGRNLRMACATAAPQGAHAAATIMAGIEGREPAPFALAYMLLAMSLGPGDGLVQRTRSDDTPRETVLGGRFGAWFNELNNRYARQILVWERRRAGAYHWAKPAGRRSVRHA